jgi:hypothetical protein
MTVVGYLKGASMLVDNVLKAILPPIRDTSDKKQQRSLKYMWIFARFVNGDGSVAFYLAEGSHSASAGYEVWGFIVASRSNFHFPIQTKMSVSALEAGDWLGRTPAVRDSAFQQGEWLDIRAKLFPQTAASR